MNEPSHGTAGMEALTPRGSFLQPLAGHTRRWLPLSTVHKQILLSKYKGFIYVCPQVQNIK